MRQSKRPLARAEQGDAAPTYACRSRHARHGTIAVLFLALTAASGCMQTSRGMHTGSIAPRGEAPPHRDPASMTADELNGAIRIYGASYERDPKNKDVGLAYAAALQTAGRNDQSLAVMQQVAISHPNDRDVLGAYGKALAAAGDLPKALDTIRRAQTPDRPDWRLLSAEGAILDQLGQSDKARILYEKALTLQPNEPSILSNLGMSRLLQNDPKSAETYLSRAAAQPGADPRVRQNLALAVGLQGRFKEAETIASNVLSPDEAEANVAYLKQMLAQRNTWSELKSERRG